LANNLCVTVYAKHYLARDIAILLRGGAVDLHYLFLLYEMLFHITKI